MTKPIIVVKVPCKLLYVIQVKEFLIKCSTSWPYLISEFLVVYITIVASDWPRTFLHPRCFCLVLFSINSGANICHTNLVHKIFLYYRGNIDGIKVDMINFQNTFMPCHPYSRSVEDNWNHFKSSLQASIIKHIPQKLLNPSVIYVG